MPSLRAVAETGPVLPASVAVADLVAAGSGVAAADFVVVAGVVAADVVAADLVAAADATAVFPWLCDPVRRTA